MSSSVASLPPPTAPIAHRASENEPIDSGTIAFDELWQDKARGLRFADLIDIVNPLQHIPVVSTVYRAITGDELGLGARLIGGALYGGAVGFGIAAFQAAAEQATGGDIGENLLAFVGLGGGEEAAPPTVLATAAAPAPAAAAATAAGPATGTAAILVASPRDGDSHAFPAHPPRSVARSQNERILAEVENARRAQAAILFASAAAERPAAGEEDASARSESDQRAAPVPAQRMAASHPNMIPRDAPPQWISRAMERALSKYEESLRLRDAAPAR